jgi:hypothetical protein
MMSELEAAIINIVNAQSVIDIHWHHWMDEHSGETLALPPFVHHAQEQLDDCHDPLLQRRVTPFLHAHQQPFAAVNLAQHEHNLAAQQRKRQLMMD